MASGLSSVLACNSLQFPRTLAVKSFGVLILNQALKKSGGVSTMLRNVARQCRSSTGVRFMRWSCSINAESDLTIPLSIDAPDWRMRGFNQLSIDVPDWQKVVFKRNVISSVKGRARCPVGTSGNLALKACIRPNIKNDAVFLET
jgi:hypothetical protein